MSESNSTEGKQFPNPSKLGKVGGETGTKNVFDNVVELEGGNYR
jgi:hypothetical protein